MRAAIVCLVVLASALVASAAFFPAFPITTFLWSGSNYFNTQNSEILTTLDTNTLAEFVAQQKTPISTYVTADAGVPEVIVAFVEPKSALSHSSYSFLENVLTGAASSVLVPYVYKTEGSGPTSAALRSSFLVTAAASASVIEASNAAELPADAFTNGVTDLILVRLPADESKATIVAEVDAAVRAATNGRYVAIYTADSEFQREQRVPSERELEIHRRVQMEEGDAQERMTRMVHEKRNSNYYSERKFWPREIWEGILVTALLLFLLWIGLHCTFDLQTPVRWEKPAKQHQQ